MPQFWKSRQIKPAQIILLGFFLLIAAGTLLLMLPVSTRDGQGAPFLDSLLTATSATCVTGLVVQDTALYWSWFGQLVILLLIQVGGMGVVTMAVAVFMFTGRKIGLRSRWIMQESISAPQMGGIVRLTGFILRAAAAIEGIGAVLLAIRFIPLLGVGRGIWYAVFHSISAFCNAGFDLMGPVSGEFSSLTSFATDPLVVAVICTLIAVGGIGFVTWYDVASFRRNLKSYRLQSKLILMTTLVLLVGAFSFFYFYEFGHEQWQMEGGERVLAAVFQAVTPRTAGFNTVDLGRLTPAGQVMTTVLMLIGGSPGSTAGGFKTTTLIIMLLSIRMIYRSEESVEFLGRRVADSSLRAACAIFTMYVGLFVVGSISLCATSGLTAVEAMFETASAVGTVGLSLSVTPRLTTAGRWIVILLMYVGRIGGLTMIYAVSSGQVPSSHFPQERVAVG